MYKEVSYAKGQHIRTVKENTSIRSITEHMETETHQIGLSNSCSARDWRCNTHSRTTHDQCDECPKHHWQGYRLQPTKALPKSEPHQSKATKRSHWAPWECFIWCRVQ